MNQKTIFSNKQGIINSLALTFGVVIFAGVVGYLVMGPRIKQIFNSETPPKIAEFGSAITFSIGQEVIFKDGLKINLKEINDSRCASGVVCIWQGELAPIFKITGGNLINTFKEIILGSVSKESIAESGYLFTLKTATENSATIIVTEKEISIGTQGVNGFIHIGPVCPVVQVGREDECADKPLATAIGIYYSNNQLYKAISSGVNGKFTTELTPGAWIIRPQVTAIFPRCEEKTINIATNGYIDIDISCDSGIR